MFVSDMEVLETNIYSVEGVKQKTVVPQKQTISS